MKGQYNSAGDVINALCFKQIVPFSNGIATLVFCIWFQHNNTAQKKSGFLH